MAGGREYYLWYPFSISADLSPNLQFWLAPFSQILIYFWCKCDIVIMHTVSYLLDNFRQQEVAVVSIIISESITAQ